MVQPRQSKPLKNAGEQTRSYSPNQHCADEDDQESQHVCNRQIRNPRHQLLGHNSIKPEARDQAADRSAEADQNARQTRAQPRKRRPQENQHENDIEPVETGGRVLQGQPAEFAAASVRPVKRAYASWYFSLVFSTTSPGREGAGGRLSQGSVSR